MVDLMRNVVKYALGTRYEDLPAETVDFTKKSILDVIGVTIAGSSAEGIKAVVELVREWGGKEESTVLIYGGKVPAVNAALAIGPMARARELGDIYDSPLRGHPTEFIFPVALPAAELRGGTTGKEFITAIAIGQDLLNRFAATLLRPLCFKPPRSAQCKYFAATATAARLLGLDEETAWNAMGIAFAQAAGETQSLKEGTLMIRMEHGLLDSAAIRSALLAQRGITGPKNILQGESGYYNAYEPEYDITPLTSELGRVFRGPEASVKPYPACRFGHSLIDAALDIATTFDIKPKDVEEIDIDVGEATYYVLCSPEEIKGNPQTVMDAQFSAPYMVATAIAKRSVWIEDFTGDAVKRPEVRQLLMITKMRVDPGIVTHDMAYGGRVTVRTKDGKERAKQVIYPKGHPKNPMSMDDVIDKFKKCLPFSSQPFPESSAHQIITMVSNLEEVDDMTKLVKLLVP